MSAGSEASPTKPGPLRLLVFMGLLALMVFLAVEVAARMLFAFKIGPSVLAYGTSWGRQQMGVELSDSDIYNTKAKLEAGYTKYFPGQVRRDKDKITGEDFSVHINSAGFRGPDFTAEKPPGVFRIVTLGASSTFGYSSPDDATYPRFLQKALAAACPGKTIEVINLGIPHLKTENIRAVFEVEGKKLKPDLVTFYEGFNDASRQPDTAVIAGADAGPLGKAPPPPPQSPLEPIKQVYRALRKRVLLIGLFDSLRLQASVGGQVGHSYGPLEPVVLDLFLNNIKALKQAVEAAGARFVVVTQQSRSLLLEREACKGVTWDQEAAKVEAKKAKGEPLTSWEWIFLRHREMVAALRVLAQAEGIPLIDGVQALDARRDLLVNWVHLAPEGNRILGQALAQGLEPMVCGGEG